MVKFAQVGDFCPQPDCRDYGKIQTAKQRNLQKFGKTKAGHQRYQCKTCQHTFTETKGTLFYRRRTDPHRILETLALIAEGSRVSSLARVKGHKEDTILDWLKEAAEHVQEIESALLAQYQLKRGQLDAMWSYVRRKAEKTQTRQTTAKSGARR